MHETSEDIEALQGRLDRSYDEAGDHLASIHTAKVRLTARELVDELVGMQVLVVATTSADGRPLSGPVDAFLHRGRWRFGTSTDALRHRHLLRRPAVSVTHVRGEGIVVTAHGRAQQVDIADDEAFQQTLVEQYGEEHLEGFLESPYWDVIEDRILAADMQRHVDG